jgi:hypothetical protein
LAPGDSYALLLPGIFSVNNSAHSRKRMAAIEAEKENESGTQKIRNPELFFLIS